MTRAALRPPSLRALLDLDGPAGLFDVGLELLGLVLVDALLDGLGGLVDERLGLLETEARGRADDLDDLDLLVAGRRDDDVERGLLLLGGSGVAATTGRSDRGRGLRGDAELLLEGLDALAQLEHRDALQFVDPFRCGLGHGLLLVFVSVRWGVVRRRLGGGLGL